MSHPDHLRHVAFVKVETQRFGQEGACEETMAFEGGVIHAVLLERTIHALKAGNGARKRDFTAAVR